MNWREDHKAGEGRIRLVEMLKDDQAQNTAYLVFAYLPQEGQW